MCFLSFMPSVRDPRRYYRGFVPTLPPASAISAFQALFHGYGGLRNPQTRRVFRYVQPRAYADRQCNIPPRNMPRPHPVRHGHAQLANDPHHHFLKPVTWLRVLRTVQHFAKYKAADSFKLSRQLQLHQHAVDLIRFCGLVLYKKKRALSTDLIRRPQRGGKHGKTAAVKYSLPSARGESRRPGLHSQSP